VAYHIGRGAVVQEQALIDALRAKRIAGCRCCASACSCVFAELRSLGAHALRGIGQPIELFTAAEL
jgi:hypothetical protein